MGICLFVCLIREELCVFWAVGYSVSIKHDSLSHRRRMSSKAHGMSRRAIGDEIGTVTCKPLAKRRLGRLPVPIAVQGAVLGSSISRAIVGWQPAKHYSSPRSGRCLGCWCWCWCCSSSCWNCRNYCVVVDDCDRCRPRARWPRDGRGRITLLERAEDCLFR